MIFPPESEAEPLQGWRADAAAQVAESRSESLDACKRQIPALILVQFPADF
ncbi:MAG: hypothetical protein ACRD25_02055 [Terracidiphilus sp.]